jgi:hypothetical protein
VTRLLVLNVGGKPEIVVNVSRTVLAMWRPARAIGEHPGARTLEIWLCGIPGSITLQEEGWTGVHERVDQGSADAAMTTRGRRIYVLENTAPHAVFPRIPVLCPSPDETIAPDVWGVLLDRDSEWETHFHADGRTSRHRRQEETEP